MYGYIYQIINLLNNKSYIGKHKSNEFVDTYMGSGKIIRRAISKYGIENFKKVILDTADTLEELNSKEKYYIQLYDAVDNEEFYNLVEGGQGSWDYVNAHRYELKIGMIGRHHTGEVKKRISDKKKGCKHTEETKQKLREISSKYRHTEETKKKIGDAHRGMKFSDEAKQHISEGLKGRKLSEEHKRHISEGGKGKKHKKMSEEGRKHISEARKAYYARLKNGTTTSN